ncbi:MAG: cation:proton antiporter, partial [Sciscionella sp.]
MYVELLILLATSIAVTKLARSVNLSAPLVLVAVGLIVSVLPGIPDFAFTHSAQAPTVILTLVLPPLLYSAALDSSYQSFRANIRSIASLAVLLVIVTTVLIGFLAHALIPALPLPTAMVLGAVVAPPDAVAAVAIGRRLGLPRTVMTLLSGESLVNDASALTLYKVAIASALGTGLSFLQGAKVFGLAVVVGIAVGLALGFAVHWVRRHLHDSVLESAVGLLVPFAAYLISEALQGSGVLAVVCAGLYLGHNAPQAGYATRLQETAVWRAVDVLLEGPVFAVIGLQLPSVIATVHGTGVATSTLLL